MKVPAPKPKPQLPPIRVEKALFNALKRKAKREGRTLTDVARCAIRDGLSLPARGDHGAQ